MTKCPVCGQPLPKAIDKQELHARLERITAQERAKERQALERDFHKRLTGAVETERERLRRSAQREVQSELLEAKRRAEYVERDKNREIERLRREGERTAERRAEVAAKMAAKQNRAEIEQLEAKRERDRARYEADRTRLQNQLDQLSRKLDKQGADQLGKEAETDLLIELNKTFQGDRIDPVRRGVKGADIVHDIMEDGKRLGRIVYESKNVSTWSNNFIRQAKQYQTQYDTPNVIVVSRSFPGKKKGLCILNNIPVVDPRMAVCLASIMRDGIREIGLARATSVGRDEKAQHLFEYILSDKFVTRFREIAESVESLRERQRKEKDWHEDAWDERSTLYDKIDARRREVDSQIRTIVKKPAKPEVVHLAAKA
jgi:chromosome segregation ATPase